MKELMQDIGIQERDPVKADYNERAPLVIPPSLTALPPPETDQPVGATNWPADPDVIKELADERARAEPDKDMSDRLSVEELREHRRSGTNNGYKTLGEIKDFEDDAGSAEGHLQDQDSQCRGHPGADRRAGAQASVRPAARISRRIAGTAL